MVAATVAAVALAACDDSGDEGKPRRSTTTSSSTTSSSTTSTSTTAPPVPPTASTIPPPVPTGTCGTQTEAIVAAINGTDMQGLNTRQGEFAVQACRLAASSPIWAAAETVANPGIALPRFTVVLQRIGSLWNVIDVGEPGFSSCDAPPQIKSDLQLGC
jgi:hypothetical protein